MHRRLVATVIDRWQGIECLRQNRLKVKRCDAAFRVIGQLCVVHAFRILKSGCFTKSFVERREDRTFGIEFVLDTLQFQLALSEGMFHLLQAFGLIRCELLFESVPFPEQICDPLGVLRYFCFAIHLLLLKHGFVLGQLFPKLGDLRLVSLLLIFVAIDLLLEAIL